MSSVWIFVVPQCVLSMCRSALSAPGVGRRRWMRPSWSWSSRSPPCSAAWACTHTAHRGSSTAATRCITVFGLLFSTSAHHLAQRWISALETATTTALYNDDSSINSSGAGHCDFSISTVKYNLNVVFWTNVSMIYRNRLHVVIVTMHNVSTLWCVIQHR